MSDSLFPEGGPHKVRKTGPDTHEFSISLPTDADGYLGRACPNVECEPGYFKVLVETLPDSPPETPATSWCPYCHTAGEQGDFHTEAQKQYAVDVMSAEAMKGVNRMMRDAFGMGRSNRRTIGGGLLSVELSLTPACERPPRPPQEEELRRNVTCPVCRSGHAVFGVAIWCPGCGGDVFLVHVQEEAGVIRTILGAVSDRQVRHGARVAGRDVENALEDTVSVLEGSLKAITRRYLLDHGKGRVEVDDVFDRVIRNGYQNIDAGERLVREHLGLELFAGIDLADRQRAAGIIAKRHPITHNFSVVDRKHLSQVSHGPSQGRDVCVQVEEVEWLLSFIGQLIEGLYLRLFPSAIRPASAGPPDTSDREEGRSG